jgi:hypothetical protein
MNKILFEQIIAIIFILGFILMIYRDKEKMNIIKKSFKDKYTNIFFILTILFYLFINYIVNNNNINLITINDKYYKRLKNITHKALFGLIISIFAHLHLFIVPFWFIFFLLYFRILDSIG